MFLKVMASALTCIGGHFLNRRWDRAILFFGLILFFLFAISTSFPYLLFFLGGQNPNVLTSSINIMLTIYLSGMFILWATSLTFTVLDAKKPVPSSTGKWTKSAVAGSWLISIASLIVLVYSIGLVKTYLAFLPMISTSGEFNESDTRIIDSDTFRGFEGYIHLGGTPSDTYTLPDPPEGKGVLKGRFTYQNKPAKGVSLGIILNSKFKTQTLITDDNGIFTVSLPHGTWTINRIEAQSWKNRPEGQSLSLFYGGEQKLEGNTYEFYPWELDKGLPVDVTEDSDKTHIDISIKPNISLIWPDNSNPEEPATIESEIRWEAYANAKKYYAAFYTIKRSGSSTRYSQATSMIVSAETSIPLNSLKHTKTNDDTKREYGVEIYAFSEDGTLLGKSVDMLDNTFLLTDGNKLLGSDRSESSSYASFDDLEDVEKRIAAENAARRKVTAVQVLIEEDMIDEANKVLALIDSKYSKGKKESLRGYLFALQGNCEKANELFDQAKSINPKICISDKYRASCKKKDQTGSLQGKQSKGTEEVF